MKKINRIGHTDRNDIGLTLHSRPLRRWYLRPRSRVRGRIRYVRRRVRTQKKYEFFNVKIFSKE